MKGFLNCPWILPERAIFASKLSEPWWLYVYVFVNVGIFGWGILLVSIGKKKIGIELRGIAGAMTAALALVSGLTYLAR